MRLLRKVTASSTVKAAIGVLDEFEHSCSSPAFHLVRDPVESAILNDRDRFVSAIKEQGRTPREKVFSMMEHVAGDYLESGSLDFFVYRGLLNPCGEEMLRIYDLIIDRMLEISCVTEEQAKKQKSDIRSCIARAC